MEGQIETGLVDSPFRDFEFSPPGDQIRFPNDHFGSDGADFPGIFGEERPTAIIPHHDVLIILQGPGQMSPFVIPSP